MKPNKGYNLYLKIYNNLHKVAILNKYFNKCNNSNRCRFQDTSSNNYVKIFHKSMFSTQHKMQIKLAKCCLPLVKFLQHREMLIFQLKPQQLMLIVFNLLKDAWNIRENKVKEDSLHSQEMDNLSILKVQVCSSKVLIQIAYLAT